MRSLVQNVVKLISVLVVVSALAFPVLVHPPVLAASSQSEICQGLGQANGSCSSGGGISHALTAAINILSFIAGIIAVIMIIISGIKFITAQGESSGVSSARMTLIYSLVGLVVVVFAQIIVHFVLARVK